MDIQKATSKKVSPYGSTNCIRFHGYNLSRHFCQHPSFKNLNDFRRQKYILFLKQTSYNAFLFFKTTTSLGI